MTTPDNPESDQQLLAAYLAGASESFTKLVHRYLPIVYAAARRQVPDATQAEDVTQAVFILLAQRARTLQKYPVLAGWLLKATGFCAADLRKMAHRRNQREREAAMNRPPHSTPSDPTTNEVTAHIDAALIGLSNTDRNALILHYFQNYTLEQTGQVLGLTKGATQQRVTRALGKLRRMLEGKGLALSVAGVGALLASSTWASAPPAGLGASTIAGTAIATAQGSIHTGLALTLSKGALHTMTMIKVKLGIGIAAATLVLSTTGAVVVHRALAENNQPVLTEQREQVAKNKIAQALYAQFHQTDFDWAPGVVDDWTTSVVGLLKEKNPQISDTQVDAICESLTRKDGVSMVEVISIMEHPLKRKMFKGRFIYAVSNYLAYGSGDPRLREQSLAQVHELLEAWKTDVHTKFPDLDPPALNSTFKGVELAVQSMSTNVLSRSWRRPGSKEILNRVSKNWGQYISQPEFTVLNTKKRQDQVRTIIWWSLNSMSHECEGPQLPRPAALVEVEREFTQNIGVISEWEGKQRRDYFDRQLREEQERINRDAMNAMKNNR